MNYRLSKRIISLMLVGVLAFSVTACGNKQKVKDEPEVEDEGDEIDEPDEPEIVIEEPTEPEAPAEPTAAVPLVFDGTRSYLTGLPIDPSLADLRPVGIMVENTKACLPHHNLDKAGVIMEAPAEGNITRYMALYDEWQNLDIIGNVRSCRTYYAEVAEEYDAIYVHWGQSPFALPYLTAGYVDDINALVAEWGGVKRGASDVAFFRHPAGVTSEHNGYTSGPGITKAIEGKGYSTTHKSAWQPHWQFAADGTKETLDGGEDCAVIVPYYYNNEPYFIYNPDDGLYYRYEFGSPEVDAESGEQYAVTNIVMEFAPDAYYQEGGKNNPKGYLEFYLQGMGTGKYFTNGKMIDITWAKPEYTGNTRYYMPDGSEIILNQGKTWFCLMETQYVDDNKYYATEEEFR